MTSAISPDNESAPTRLAAANREPPRPLILLVDDDARLRSVVRAVVCYAMATSGTVADIIEATDAFDAVSIARAVGRSIDLLISDVRLGSGSSGIELARELSFTSPRIRIVLMSGTDLRRNEISNGWHFLPKPFRVSELIDLISPPGHYWRRPLA